MLHKCQSCAQIYLVSDYTFLCNWCGSERQKQIEKLLERDNAVEWTTLVSVIAHGEQVRPERRWEVK